MSKIDYQELLKRPMTRKQFLRNVGLLIIGIIGVSNALKILSSDQTDKGLNSSTRGYGSSKYGN